MIVGLDVWEVVDLVVEVRGESILGDLSFFGMEEVLRKYENGVYDERGHRFYDENRLFFNLYYKKAQDLKKRFEEYEVGMRR